MMKTEQEIKNKIKEIESLYTDDRELCPFGSPQTYAEKEFIIEYLKWVIEDE